MSGKTILPLAVEMMEATNTYKKHIEEFRYSFKEANERNYVSLYDTL